MRPAVRGQTNRYNNKIRLGRGFTKRELNAAGILSLNEARSFGIAVDLRRKDTSNETLTSNTNRIKTYLSKIVLHPRKEGKNAKKSTIPEATKEVLAGPNAKSQNTTKEVIPLPKPEAGFSWTQNVTKEAQAASAYKTLRTEWKTATGYYKRLEAFKKKANAPKK